MDSALFKAILPQRKQFMHLCCSFTRWNSSEADSLPSVGRLLNDIGVFFFILPRVPNSAPSQSVKFSNRSEEHTSELQSRLHLVCRLLLEKKKNTKKHCKHYHCDPYITLSMRTPAI